MRLWSRLGSLVRKLQRRGVLRASAVYAVTAWIAVQVAAATFPALPVPPWAHTLVVLLAIFGLPVVVAVAWAYEITPEGVQRTVEEEQPPELLHARGTPWVALVLVAVVTAASGGLGWTAWNVWLSPGMEAVAARTDSAPAAEEEPLPRTRVAVLPLNFDSTGSANATRNVADGLTRDLNSDLDRIEALDVVSHRGVLPYRAPNVGLDSVARATGAGSLVTGSVRDEGDSLEVHISLVNARGYTSDWNETLRASRDSLLPLRDSILAEAVRGLRRALGEEIQKDESRRGPVSNEALEQFYDGKGAAADAEQLRSEGLREVARRRYERADSLLTEAEEEDPDWVKPTIERGWLEWNRARLPGRAIDEMNYDRFREGLEHASRALSSVPGHPAALEIRGVLLHALSLEPGNDSASALQQEAIEDLERAVGKDQDLARAWAELSDLYRRRAQFDKAYTAAENAREADPFLINEATYLKTATHVALDSRHFGRALDLIRLGRKRYSDNVWWDQARLMLHASAGAPRVPPDTAWAMLDRFERLYGGESPPARMQVAAVLARQGMDDSARAVLRRARSAMPEELRAHRYYYEANVRLHLGERDRCLELLRAYLRENPGRGEYVAHDVWWAPVRGDSAFRALVASRD